MGITFENVTAIYTRSEFANAFRMSREVFADLLNVTRDQIQKNIEMGRRSRRTTVPADIRLSITLRIMAGTYVWDLVAVQQTQEWVDS